MYIHVSYDAFEVPFTGKRRSRVRKYWEHTVPVTKVKTA
jgi:hypothetical protein